MSRRLARVFKRCACYAGAQRIAFARISNWLDDTLTAPRRAPNAALGYRRRHWCRPFEMSR
jgi:hypothetical protein